MFQQLQRVRVSSLMWLYGHRDTNTQPHTEHTHTYTQTPHAHTQTTHTHTQPTHTHIPRHTTHHTPPFTPHKTQSPSNSVQHVIGNKQQICKEYPATFHIELCAAYGVSHNANKPYRRMFVLCV